MIVMAVTCISVNGTSMCFFSGNLDVWHGCLDMIMDGADVVIYTLDGKSETYRDVDSAEDVKPTHFDMMDNSAGSSLVQVAADYCVLLLPQTNSPRS